MCESEIKWTYAIILVKTMLILTMFAVVMHQDHKIKVLEACLNQPYLPDCAELKKEK